MKNQAIIANLKSAVFNRKSVHIAGGDFEGEELQAVIDVLESTLPDPRPTPPGKHTPGPWTTGRHLKNTGATPIRAKGENLAWVCGLDSALELPKAETEANALLIAAAPDLLEALKELAEEINLSSLNIRKDFSLINAHACALKAIHEATGA